jgi:hypothetical protein
MISPSADELAAITAAYLILTRREDAAENVPDPPRWALAGRLPVDDAPETRFAARSASRWAAAGRLDG